MVHTALEKLERFLASDFCENPKLYKALLMQTESLQNEKNAQYLLDNILLVQQDNPNSIKDILYCSDTVLFAVEYSDYLFGAVKSFERITGCVLKFRNTGVSTYKAFLLIQSKNPDNKVEKKLLCNFLAYFIWEDLIFDLICFLENIQEN